MKKTNKPTSAFVIDEAYRASLVGPFPVSANLYLKSLLSGCC